VAVSGKLLLANGSPVAAGTLVLRPVNGLHGATAPIGKDGSFTLTDSAGRPGVIPGQYLVYVRFPNPEDAAMRGTVPARYQSTEDADSDVTVDIPSATDKLLIKLKR
jgi:hypothetical protein